MIGLISLIFGAAISFFVIALIELIHNAIIGETDDTISIIITLILASFNIILALICFYFLL